MINDFFSKQSLLLVFIKKILGKDPFNYISVENNSKISYNGTLIKKYVSIISKDNSTIHIGDNVILENVVICCESNSTLVIQDNVVIKNTEIRLLNNSKSNIGVHTIIGSFKMHQTNIYINSGIFSTANRCKLFLEKIQVRFGGELSVGRYSGFGFFTDIRCDEKIQIGDYLLCSYHATIYDSNIHSIDPELRRKNIENQFPSGLTDFVKPKTAPVLIGDNVWIGKYAAILKGCNIHSNSIVGLGAVLSNIKDSESKNYVCQKPRIF